MLAEAIPRLVVRLRSTFTDARVELRAPNKLTISFPANPSWEVEVESRPLADDGRCGFQVIQSSLTIRFESLQTISESDFQHFIAAENHGLRGVSLLGDHEGNRRVIRARASFVGQKGRSRDEAENLTIDVISLFRYARLLEDRILRSTACGDFCYEMFHSQYIYRGRGRNRFINFARTIFQGSSERAFGQVASMLQDNYKYRVQVTGPCVAKVTPPSSTLEIVLRIPEEVPMLTLYAPLHTTTWDTVRTMALVSRLNWETRNGHFELGPDGKLVSFVAWKQLTNDLRFFSLDTLITSIHHAETLLHAELPPTTPLPDHAKDELAIPVAALRRAV